MKPLQEQRFAILAAVDRYRLIAAGYFRKDDNGVFQRNKIFHPLPSSTSSEVGDEEFPRPFL